MESVKKPRGCKPGLISSGCILPNFHCSDKNFRVREQGGSPFCSTGVQQLAHLSPPVRHLVKHYPLLVNLLFQHELSPKGFIKTVGSNIRFQDPNEQRMHAQLDESLDDVLD